MKTTEEKDAAEPKPKKTPAVTIGPFAFPKSTAFAADHVDTNKDWSWPVDGPDLKQAIELAYDELKEQGEKILSAFGLSWSLVNLGLIKQIVTAVVKRWDDVFDWDPKRMTEQEEDAFYAVLAKAAVDARHNGGTTVRRMEITKPVATSAAAAAAA